MSHSDSEREVFRLDARLTVGDQAGDLSINLPPGQKTMPIQTVGAARFADLLSIQTDLEHVQAWCRLLLESDQPDEVADALWEASLISYRRTFTGGAPAIRGIKGHRSRRRLTVELEIFTPEDRSFHRKILTLADKHVAHRADPAGEAIRIVEITDEVTGRRLGMGYLGVRRVSTGKQDIATLHELVTKLKDHIEELLEAERSEL